MKKIKEKIKLKLTMDVNERIVKKYFELRGYFVKTKCEIGDFRNLEKIFILYFYLFL